MASGHKIRRVAPDFHRIIYGFMSTYITYYILVVVQRRLIITGWTQIGFPLARLTVEGCGGVSYMYRQCTLNIRGNVSLSVLQLSPHALTFMHCTNGGPPHPLSTQEQECMNICDVGVELPIQLWVRSNSIVWFKIYIYIKKIHLTCKNNLLRTQL